MATTMEDSRPRLSFCGSPDIMRHVSSSRRDPDPSGLRSNLNRLALFLFALGALFALEARLELRILSRLWPLLLTSLGGGFIGIFLERERREPFFLGIGVYLISFSLFALTCSFTSWRLMAELWPLFIGFLGLSFLALYLASPRHAIHLFFAILFFSVCALFLLVFSIAAHLWWILFFFLGLAIHVLAREQP